MEAAARAGVRHIVKLSQFAASPNSPMRYHAAVEQVIRDTGMDWTFLRPNLFMQGMLQFAGMVRDKGMTRTMPITGAARRPKLRPAYVRDATGEGLRAFAGFPSDYADAFKSN